MPARTKPPLLSIETSVLPMVVSEKGVERVCICFEADMSTPVQLRCSHMDFEKEGVNCVDLVSLDEGPDSYAL